MAHSRSEHTHTTIPQTSAQQSQPLSQPKSKRSPPRTSSDQRRVSSRRYFYKSWLMLPARVYPNLNTSPGLPTGSANAWGQKTQQTKPSSESTTTSRLASSAPMFKYMAVATWCLPQNSNYSTSPEQRTGTWTAPSYSADLPSPSSSPWTLRKTGWSRQAGAPPVRRNVGEEQSSISGSNMTTTRGPPDSYWKPVLSWTVLFKEQQTPQPSQTKGSFRSHQIK